MQKSVGAKLTASRAFRCCANKEGGVSISPKNQVVPRSRKAFDSRLWGYPPPLHHAAT